MRIFRLIDTYTNTVVMEVSNDIFVRGEEYSDSIRFVDADVTDLTENQKSGVYHGRRRISQLEFMQLLTSAERKAVRQAAKSNADLEDFLDLLDKASHVNLDSVNTISGLTVLEQSGLLTTGRAQEILNG